MKKVRFDDLDCGDFFKFGGILRIKDSCGDSVSLKNGQIKDFYAYQKVQPVTVKITVKG